MSARVLARLTRDVMRRQYSFVGSQFRVLDAVRDALGLTPKESSDV